MNHLTSRASLLKIVRDAAIGFVTFAILAIVTMTPTNSLTTLNFRDFLNLYSEQATYSPRALSPSHLTSSIRNLGSTTSLALLRPDSATRYPAVGLFQNTGRLSAFIMMAIIFSGFVAFNLAWLRHLREVYAPKSRRRTYFP